MTTPLPALPTAPNRSMPQGVFSPAMDAFLAALVTFRDSLEANRPDIDQAIADAAQVAIDRIATQAARDAAVAAAASAANAPGTSATTTTSITPAAGAISFTLAQTGKLFSLGQTVVVASAAAPATKYLLGVVTAFNSATGAMTLSVAAGNFAGAAFADGTVSLSASAGVQAIAGLSGVVSAAALKAALGAAVSDITDYATDQATRAAALKAQAIAFATAL